MIDPDEEYRQLSEDWRNRDRITWGLLGILGIVGALIVGIYGELEPNDTQITTVLLWAGFSMSLLVTIMLLRNLYLQALGEYLMEKFKNGDISAQDFVKYASRVPRRGRDLSILRALWRTTKTFSSTWLFILCIVTTGLFLYLQYGYRWPYLVVGAAISLFAALGFIWISDRMSK